MPEKIADRVEEDTRRYMREAEDVAQETFRRSNDLMTTTMKYYFNSFDMFMRYTMELTDHTQRAMNNMMTVYRKGYTESMKDWEDYVNQVNKIVIRPTK
jgi:hypothetical protein